MWAITKSKRVLGHAEAPWPLDLALGLFTKQATPFNNSSSQSYLIPLALISNDLTPSVLTLSTLHITHWAKYFLLRINISTRCWTVGVRWRLATASTDAIILSAWEISATQSASYQSNPGGITCHCDRSKFYAHDNFQRQRVFTTPREAGSLQYLACKSSGSNTGSEPAYLNQRLPPSQMFPWMKLQGCLS